MPPICWFKTVDSINCCYWRIKGIIGFGLFFLFFKYVKKNSWIFLKKGWSCQGEINIYEKIVKPWSLIFQKWSTESLVYRDLPTNKLLFSHFKHLHYKNILLNWESLWSFIIPRVIHLNQSWRVKKIIEILRVLIYIFENYIKNKQISMTNRLHYYGFLDLNLWRLIISILINSEK